MIYSNERSNIYYTSMHCHTNMCITDDYSPASTPNYTNFNQIGKKVTLQTMLCVFSIPIVPTSCLTVSCPGPSIKLNVSATDNTLNIMLVVLLFRLLCENTDIHTLHIWSN